MEVVHFTGAFMVFIGGFIYACLQTALTYHMYPDYNGLYIGRIRLTISFVCAVSLIISILVYWPEQIFLLVLDQLTEGHVQFCLSISVGKCYVCYLMVKAFCGAVFGLRSIPISDPLTYFFVTMCLATCSYLTKCFGCLCLC